MGTIYVDNRDNWHPVRSGGLCRCSKWAYTGVCETERKYAEFIGQDPKRSDDSAPDPPAADSEDGVRTG